MTHIADDRINSPILAHGFIDHCLQIINLKNRSRTTYATEFLR